MKSIYIVPSLLTNVSIPTHADSFVPKDTKVKKYGMSMKMTPELQAAHKDVAALA